jgi:thioesterase domain-containing protein/acyl carrier protein
VGELVGPRDALESRLAALWEELLGVTPVGIRSSFFELGGHSLLAVRMMRAIRRDLGLDLPLSTLFEWPTVEALAALLRRQEGARVASPLVAIQPEGARSPLFCVHPAGGHVLCYEPLAKYLGQDRPLYALEDPELSGGRPWSTVEDSAACYLASVRQVQPHGPYFLAGWSSGGLIAFEMAHQLRAAGEVVGLLFLLDTFVFPPRELPRGEDDETDGLVAQGWLLPEERALAPEARLARALARWREKNPEGAVALDVEGLRRLFAVYRRNQRAAVSYVPRPYAGPVALFRCTLEEDADAAATWEGLLQDGEILDVAAVHSELLSEPHVRELAARLRRLLDEPLLPMEARGLPGPCDLPASFTLACGPAQEAS